jgi:predicted aspartyl protease
MVVLRQGAGASAYVRLKIKDRNYVFKIDTGAARTEVSRSLAEALQLPKRGHSSAVSTLGCKTSVQHRVVSDWALGGKELAPMTIGAEKNLVGGPNIAGRPVAGLLGSDVLSRFAAVTLDFAHRRLVLGSSVPTGGQGIPMSVGHGKQGGAYETIRAVTDGTPADWLIDTGATYTLVAARTVAQLKLHRVGRSVTGLGASGCSARLDPVAINNWTAGSVRLPPTVALASTSPVVSKYGSTKIDGIIGADVLSHFHQVTLDFRTKRTLLGSVAPH